uniref:Uncharacterized protein n=1 Tax=Panagrellus redivivus TaxID=6233 RepID=A0A7E4VQW9_PANRE
MASHLTKDIEHLFEINEVSVRKSVFTQLVEDNDSLGGMESDRSLTATREPSKFVVFIMSVFKLSRHH